MRRHNTMMVVLGAGTLLGALSIPASALASPPIKQPPASVGVATSQAMTKAVKDARFVNQNGQPETLGGLVGKTVFVVPFLTLCGDTCPFTTGNLVQLQSIISNDKVKNVEVVAIDVDPYRDTLTRIKVYSKLIGANFQLWTETGATTVPKAPKSGASMNSMSGSVGTGDLNANLTTIEKFLGWTVQVVDQDTPPSTDWMAPHEKLTYDINHSDGFWVINADQQIDRVWGDVKTALGKPGQLH